MSIASSNANSPFRVVSRLDTMAAKAPMKIEGLAESEKLADTARALQQVQNSPIADEARRRSDRDETADSARAVADGAPLALQPPIHEHPEEATEARRQVGVGDGDGRLDVCRKGRASVESTPLNAIQQQGRNGGQSKTRRKAGEVSRSTWRRKTRSCATHTDYRPQPPSVSAEYGRTSRYAYHVWCKEAKSRGRKCRSIK